MPTKVVKPKKEDGLAEALKRRRRRGKGNY